MADLGRLQNSQPVQLVDANDLLVCDITTIAPTGTESGLIVRVIPSGTQAVSGTITAIPTGTYTIVPTGTQAVSGTVTAVPTGTQAVSGTITAVPTGTYTIVPSGTQAVSGTITASPTGTYTVATSAESSIGAGAAPSKAIVSAGVYNTTIPTATAGQTLALQTDANGDLRVNINGAPVTTSTVTQVTVSNSVSTTLAATNLNRTKVSIYNGGANNIYIKIGVTASTTSFTLILLPGGLYEDPAPAYFGQIDAIASTAATVVNITEV